MQAVFDQHTQADRSGLVRGGDGKLGCVGSLKLSRARIWGLVATPCRDIIEEMRSLFHDLYLHEEAGNLPSHVRSIIQAYREQDPRVKAAREKLRTSDAFLAIFERYLQIEWGVDNDGSLDLVEPRVDTSASRNRRKRKAEDCDSSELNIHLRRIGRMPPKSSPRSVDKVSSQTSSCHDNIFSISSRAHSLSGDLLSSNLRSESGGALAKQ